MDDLTTYFAGFVSKVLPHETLRGIFNKSLNSQESFKRRKYFGVVDICDILQTYFKLKYPDVFEHSIKTKKKFSIGNKHHKIIEKKIEDVEGFVDSEVILDGELMGIALKGRADAKVKDSIWEIKSKAKLPMSVDDLLERYPQDVEQLCFYSLLDPQKPLVNYLVFVSQINPDEYKVFKVSINNLGKVKNLALNRINKLNKWLDSGLCDNSLRCRYCYDDCVLRMKGICSFFVNKMPQCGVREFISVEEDFEIEKILGNIKFVEDDLVKYSIYNLITPRKVIHRENEDIEEEVYDGGDKFLSKQLISDLVFRDYGISFEDFKNLENSKRIKEIYQNKSSFIKRVCNGVEKIFPVLIHVSESKHPASLNNPSDYKKGELGIHCLNNKFNKGYLISYFPNQDNEVRVFEITYRFEGEREIVSGLRDVVGILNEKNSERVNELLRCPDFIHRDCVFRGVCEKNL
jgi:hypothetical protein